MSDISNAGFSRGIDDETIVAAIIKQVVSALNYIHSCNIIHRDIKSDNIYVEVSGNVRVLDFGACARVSCESLIKLISSSIQEHRFQ